jgi:hypothetical protein
MTGTRFEMREQSIHEVLAGRAEPVTTRGRGKWELAVDGHPGRAIEVRLEDEWVWCRAPIPRAEKFNNVDDFIWRNPRLPGGCRVVFDPRHSDVHLREDIPVVDGIDVSTACDRAITDLVAARNVLATKGRPRTAGAGRPRPSRDVAERTDTLESICGAAGWRYAERDGGRGVVTLELAHGAVPARLDARGESNYRASAQAARYPALSEAGRRAVAVLMLTVNGIVRFVRAGIEQSADGLSAFFERRFCELPSPAVLDAALSALSVACGLCGRELQALENDDVARQYLATRGMSLAPAVG